MNLFKMAKFFNIMLKWWNFAKSGHTARNSHKDGMVKRAKRLFPEWYYQKIKYILLRTLRLIFWFPIAKNPESSSVSLSEVHISWIVCLVVKSKTNTMFEL